MAFTYSKKQFTNEVKNIIGDRLLYIRVEEYTYYNTKNSEFHIFKFPIPYKYWVFIRFIDKNTGNEFSLPVGGDNLKEIQEKILNQLKTL